jgi:hypothetical protein
MMIDKLEVRVPAQAQYSRDFGAFYSAIHCSDKNPFRPSSHYLRVGDLRAFGYGVVLHAHCVHGSGNHKLELIDTGQATLAEMSREIERVFDVDSRRLEITRIDLAADVLGVPVPWFLAHLRAKWKRFVADIGEVEYARMGKLAVETLYLGKRPNCYRIYNKIAELHYQHARLKVPDGQPKPSFEALYGLPETGLILTRVERQIGGGRLPAEIGTVGQLRRLPDFNPFDKLEILAGVAGTPNIEDCGLTTYLEGLGLRQMVIENGGIHRTRALLNKYSPGNGARLLRKLAPFLGDSDHAVTVEGIREVYRESVTSQLAA